MALPVVKSANGHTVLLQDGRSLFDACGGAAVACIGYGREEVVEAMAKQARSVAYVPWAFFDNEAALELRKWLLASSGGEMHKAYIMSSGSEAVEAAMKLARQFFLWSGQPQRSAYIARDLSYHGCTIGSLSLSGHSARRQPFIPLLNSASIQHISSYNPYRFQATGQTTAEYEALLEAELDAKFHALGADTVAAVILEPVVGAAMGCVPASPSYLAMVRRLCDKYGALLIFDEVMCGMGRTGTLHAWQNPEITGPESVVPDLQTVGKGLAGGYAPASALLVGKTVAAKMDATDAIFTHGHTYQDHPVVCAAALAVQQYIVNNQLLANVQAMGARLGQQLRRHVANIPQVGNVRGIGMFWGIELVMDRESKRSFPVEETVAYKVHRVGVESKATLVYYGQGCGGNKTGDHIMLCPAYDVTEEEVDKLAETVGEMIRDFLFVFITKKMKEILTVQLGELANYIGTHFWNTQESYFTYSKDDVSLINHDIHWRQGLGADGSETYLPRTLVYDFKQNLGSLRQISPLYDPDDDSTTAWAQTPSVHRADPIAPSAFQAALDAGRPPLRPSATDVRFWSDTARVYLHPRSLVALDNIELAAPKDAAAVGPAPWARGTQLFHTLDAAHDLLDRDLRPLAEEADCLQAVQVVAALDDVWAPFAAAYVERLRDDFGKTCVLVWGPTTPEAPADSAAMRRARIEAKARALVDLYAHASLVVPLAAPPRVPSAYALDWTCKWHVGGLYATAMETAGLATRLARGAVGMDEVQGVLNAHGGQRLMRLRMTARREDATALETAGQEASAEGDMPETDLDMLDLLGPTAGRMRARSAGDSTQVFSRILTERSAHSAAAAVRTTPEYIGRTVTRRYAVPQGFPLLDSFPSIYTGMRDVADETAAVQVVVSADSGVSNEMEALKRVAVGTVGAADREELGNGLSEIVDEYRDGWWSGSESEDD
ncbi:hypothetical protein TD95_001040 [Thielaviopsis punctulata]|uniref:Uncharacterized protein n=1 Tax=Thielaviopsis punctulata TaxID=72032 RepID=A0A0F4ZIJ5_9PEZI|nr:hypothetical protein TD95_001040 [Thielaviopsis punctulata]